MQIVSQGSFLSNLVGMFHQILEELMSPPTLGAVSFLFSPFANIDLYIHKGKE